MITVCFLIIFNLSTLCKLEIKQRNIYVLEMYAKEKKIKLLIIIYI